MTRHRDRLDLHWSRDTIPTRAKLDAVLSRLALKDTSLDYADDSVAEAQARRDTCAEMRERIQARAAAFSQREETVAGRMANARALLPAGATPLAIARLALSATERLRLFRGRQGRLRQWARRIMPAAVAAMLPARPAPAARVTVMRTHDAAALQQLRAMEARHAAERRQEQGIRTILQREAAQSWRAMAGAVPPPVRQVGYGVAHWRVAQHSANDNRSAPWPPAPRPRPF